MRTLVTLWVLSLVAIAVLSAVLTAQVNRQTPRVVTGADLGFRIEGREQATGKPFGTIVVRVNGEWVEVGSGGAIVPATK